jgi:ABC-type oligopeptide transport system substrate-binding subunit
MASPRAVVPPLALDAITAGLAVVSTLHRDRLERDLMNATVDETELKALISEAEKILADNLVIIPLYQRLDPGAVWADKIGGYKHNPSQAGDAWNIELWYRIDLG